MLSHARLYVRCCGPHQQPSPCPHWAFKLVETHSEIISCTKNSLYLAKRPSRLTDTVEPWIILVLSLPDRASLPSGEGRLYVSASSRGLPQAHIQSRGCIQVPLNDGHSTSRNKRLPLLDSVPSCSFETFPSIELQPPSLWLPLIGPRTSQNKSAFSNLQI